MEQPSCELPLVNASTARIDEILRTVRTVAIVGLSDKPDRDSNLVARHLQRAGYRVIPVNPAISEAVGERAYPDLARVPAEIRIDVVDIFRKPEAIPPIVDAAIARGARVVWMQLGLVHNAAAEKARAAGLEVVMDRCIKVEHERFVAASTSTP